MPKTYYQTYNRNLEEPRTAKLRREHSKPTSVEACPQGQVEHLLDNGGFGGIGETKDMRMNWQKIRGCPLELSHFGAAELQP